MTKIAISSVYHHNTHKGKVNYKKSINQLTRRDNPNFK